MENQISEDEARHLFDQYATYVFKTAFLLCKSQSLADDIVQETFLHVFRKMHTYDSSKPFEPWLYRITVNITKNILRKQKWLLFSSDTKEQEDRTVPTPTESLLRSEMTVAIRNEINNLSLKNKEVIVLHFYTGLTLNEVSETLGIPIGTCKSRLNTALKKLRERLGDSGFLSVHNEEGFI